MNCPDCANGWLHAAVITVEDKKRIGLVCSKCGHKQLLPREGAAQRPLFQLHLAASNKPKYLINRFPAKIFTRLEFVAADQERGGV